tara:strand:- start:909 stop:1286 length:378 start_codon:yes stop_codon:yes gene_type:complete
MAGLAVKLPLTRNSRDGFNLINNLKELTKQNLKMLILTNPGERMMDPNFGVGLRRFIFRTKAPEVAIEIKTRIQEQVTRYIPAISLRDVTIEGLDNPDNKIFVKVVYFMPGLNEFDILDFKFFGD